MRIILLDTRAHFRDDVRTRLLVDDDRNVELLTDLANSSGLGTAIATFKPELIVVADNVYPEQSNWTSYGIPVVGYITKPTNPDIFAADGIPAYSNVGGAANLLNLLETGVPAAKTQAPAPAQQQSYQTAPQYGAVSGSTGAPAAPVSAGMYQPMGMPETSTEAPQRRPQVSFNPPADDDEKPTDIFHGTANWASSQPNTSQSQLPQYPGNQQSKKSGALQSRNPGAWLYHDEPDYQPMPQMPKVQQPVAPQPMTQQPVVQQPARYEPPVSEGYTKQTVRPEPATPQNYGQPAPSQTGFYDPGYPGYSAMGMNPMQSPTPVKEQLDENRRIRNDAMTSNTVLNDIAVRNTPTKTVAVYAAKPLNGLLIALESNPIKDGSVGGKRHIYTASSMYNYRSSFCAEVYYCSHNSHLPEKYGYGIRCRIYVGGWELQHTYNVIGTINNVKRCAYKYVIPPRSPTSHKYRNLSAYVRGIGEYGVKTA